MRARIHRSAKTAVPHTAALVPRPKLYARFDRAADARFAWLSAPAGAGKTSLVAAYLAARGRPTAWVRLDEGDADLTAFLQSLGEGVRVAGGARTRIDVAATATAADIAIRRSVEAIVAGLPPASALVLDGYEAIPPGAPAERALALVVASLPAGTTLFVTSRRAPPPALARAGSGSGFLRLEGADLWLDHDEAAAVAASTGLQASDPLRAVAAACGGWAAGVVLLARGLLAGGPLPGAATPLPREISDYFAAEVFEPLPPDVQSFLARTAALPRVSPDTAGALTGHAEPGRVLDELCRANLFTERKAGDAPRYAYHPLFRHFLRARAATLLAAREHRDNRALAARLLEDAQDPEAAVPLLAELGAASEIARLVRSHAPALASQGRIATLTSWCDALSEQGCESEPWPLFWRAWCLAPDDRARAAGGFERARAAFAAAGDLEGELACCARLACLATTRAAADRRIAELEAAAARLPELLEPDQAARRLAAIGLPWAFPARHALVERWRAQAETLARTAASAGTRLALASFALAVHLLHGETDAMGALIAEHRHVAEDARAAAGEALPFLVLQAHHLLASGADAAAQATRDRAAALAASTGHGPHAIAVAALSFALALARGEAEAARAALATLTPARTPLDEAFRLVAQATLALAAGDAEAARTAATAARAPVMLVPALEPARAACAAAALLMADEPADAALAAIVPALDAARRDRMPAAELALLLLAGSADLRCGDTAKAVAHAAEAFRLGVRTGALPRLPFLPRPMLADLAALALANDVAPRYATRLIARMRLEPPPGAPASWPWPLRVRTLGAFRVEALAHGTPANGGLARKPNELLKFVIAAGAGHAVAAGAAVAALWPDLEGDAGKKAFDIALHRLRKALGVEGAVRLEAGKLSLDPELVWVDTVAFQRAARAAERSDANAATADRAAAEALSLYDGPFLAADDDLPWAMPQRVRLRDWFVRLVERAAGRWEAAGEAARAEDLCRAAIRVEPTCEPLHRQLIELLERSGRPAQAREAYLHCRELLAAVAAARPSPRTEALRARLEPVRTGDDRVGGM
ncbi:MAG: hypothetical protein N2544_01660 [Burkholderiales bacterium]|nr:hypothetical protein [Burkholderiales bacterium]